MLTKHVEKGIKGEEEKDFPCLNTNLPTNVNMKQLEPTFIAVIFKFTAAAAARTGSLRRRPGRFNDAASSAVSDH